MLQLRDKRYNDVRLIFKEDEHKYTDTLGNEYLSTTTFLHDYSPRFDKSYWLRKKAKELGISEKKLAAQWDAIRDEACDRGSKTHNGLEDGVKLVSKFNDAIRYSQQYEDNSMSTIADLPQIDKHIKELDVKAFIDYTEGKYTDLYNVFDYYTKNGYKIYAEIGAFLIDYLLSGTIDVLCIRDDKFVIGDYKTNRGGLKFESGYFKKDKTENLHKILIFGFLKMNGCCLLLIIFLIVMVLFIICSFLFMPLMWKSFLAFLVLVYGFVI